MIELESDKGAGITVVTPSDSFRKKDFFVSGQKDITISGKRGHAQWINNHVESFPGPKPRFLNIYKLIHTLLYSSYFSP